jgi:alpha-L-arabinofuranosidase
MYRAHMNGRVAPCRIQTEETPAPLLEGVGRLAAIDGSASIRDRSITLTLTNRSTGASVNARIAAAGGAQILEARGSVLTSADPAAANTFAAPDQLRPSTLAVTLRGNLATVSLPRQSVAAVTLRIA